MPGENFVGSKCPIISGAFFSSRLPVLVTAIGPLIFRLVYTCTRSYTKRLIDFQTGLLYYKDVYMVIAINPVNFSIQHGGSLESDDRCF